MKKKETFITHRTPADMHGDGVYFNDYLLSLKKEKERQSNKVTSNS